MVLNRSYKTEGIVLKRTNYGEADRIVTLYCRRFGKITCLAKGVRKLASRKKGALEIFNRIIFFAVEGKGMDIITETETLETYPGLRRDLSKIAAAYEVSEIIDKLTVANQPQDEVYDLLSAYLKKIMTADDLEGLIFSFGETLVKYLGFWPPDKPIPPNFEMPSFIEQICERELKSKNFLKKCCKISNDGKFNGKSSVSL